MKTKSTTNRFRHPSRRSRVFSQGFAEPLESRLLLAAADTDGVDVAAQFTVVDQSRKALIFDQDFQSSESYRLQETPRGVTSNEDGSLTWTIHRSGIVSVYNAQNQSIGEWRADGIIGAEGIATDGSSIWILDSGVAGVNKVFFFADAAQLTNGLVTADSEFPLTAENDEGWGLATDGQHVWVLNSNVTDEVFKYTTSGELAGSWLLDSANPLPRGLTIDPANPTDMWTVDRQNRKVFRYENVVSQNSGAASATSIIRLPAAAKTAQGIAASIVSTDPDGPEEPPAGPPAIAVLDDRPNQILQYDAAGTQVANNALEKANGTPRGAAAVENTEWVIDRKRTVFVYENGSVAGTWRADGLRKPEGLASNGDDIWVVDRTLNEVLLFAGGAALRSGEHAATESFSLHANNRNARGITTDGTHLWVVNGGRVSEVFQYDLTGNLVGRWAIDGRVSPRGIAVDKEGTIWIVEKRASHVLQFADAASRVSGTQPGVQFPLGTRYRAAEAVYVPLTVSGDAGGGTAAAFAEESISALNELSSGTSVDEPVFDFDGDNNVSALTDGILLMRYLAGFRGETNIAGIGIADRVEQYSNVFDIDGDGETSALTDGILALRYMAGFRGAALIERAVGPTATRSGSQAVEEFLLAEIDPTHSTSTDDFFATPVSDQSDEDEFTFLFSSP